MRFCTLYLKEFCQYRERTFEFAPGLTAITGPNGVGKSNLVKAGYGAFTNDWSRNQGGKEANICQHASKKAASSVLLTFEHQHFYTVERSFQPSRHRLEMPGKTIHGEEEVNRHIQHILGISPWALDTLLFVDQGKAASFLLETSSKRTKNFQALFGLDWLSKVWDWLGQESRALPSLALDPAHVRFNLEQTQTQLSLKSQERELLLARLPGGDAQADREAYAKSRRAQTLTEDLKRLTRQRDRDEAEVRKVRQEMTSVEEDLGTLRQAEEQDRLAATEARAVLARAVLLRRRYEACEAAQAQLALLVEQEARDPAPATPAWLAGQAPEERLAEIDRELSPLQIWLGRYNPFFGQDACPECGTPGVDLKERRRAYEVRVRELEPQLLELKAWLARHKVWAQRSALRHKQRQEAQALLTANQGEAPPDEAALTDTVLSYDTVAGALRVLEQRRSELTARLEEKMLAQTRLGKQVRQLKGELEGLGTLVPEAELLERINCRTDCDKKLAAVEAQLALLTQRREQLVQELDKAQVDWAQYCAQKDWAERAARLRPLLDYDQLPRTLLRDCLRQVEKSAHEFLRMFEAPFTFETGEDLTLTVTKVDGVKHREARLSGAELLVLALSFRLALLETFTAGLGFLCLDEPTYGLDVDNRRALGGVMDRLRDYSRSSGTQILLVTHEPALVARCDQKIDLGGGVL